MLRILDITAPDINNGNGIRVTLWVSGCTHHCKGCHNQWTWDFKQGKSWKENRESILRKLDKWLSRDYVEGITFSGGDPLCQDDEGLQEECEIIKYVRDKYPDKDIWMYTGGTYEDLRKSGNENVDKILDSVDVLVDGPFILEKRDIAHTPFRGSTNQRILYLKK